MSSRVDDDVILDAVVATVIAHGYAGATTRQIAAAAGVNEVTLFRCFESKQRLVLAAIHRDLGQIAGSSLRPSGALEADLAVLSRYEQGYRRRPALPLIIILEATRNPELAKLIDEPIAAQVELRELIAAYQRSGELREEPPEHAVNALIGSLLAYAADAQLGIAPASGPPSPRELLDQFLRGHQST